MRILNISDFHLSGDLYESKMIALEQATRKRDFDMLVFAGDIFHQSRVGGGGRSASQIIAGLEKALTFDKPVVMIEGNHDLMGTKNSALDYLHMPNLVKVKDSPMWMGFEDTEILFIPWIRNRLDYKKFVLGEMNRIEPTRKHRLLVGHMCIVDATMNQTHKVNADDYFSFGLRELQHTVFMPTSLLAGHLHSRQLLGSGFGAYVGGFTQNSFGEGQNPMGYAYWERDQIEFVDVEAPRWISCTEDEYLAVPEEQRTEFYRFATEQPERYRDIANVKPLTFEEFTPRTGPEKAYSNDISLKDLIQEYCSEAQIEIPKGEFVLEELNKLELRICRAQTGFSRLNKIHLKNFGPKGNIVHKNTEISFEDGLVAVIGRNGSGKAQPLTEKILTPTGWKTMGSMRVGSRVFDEMGNVSRVTGVFYKGFKDIYRVSFSDGSSTECCVDHLWKIRDSGKKKEKTWRVTSLWDLILDSRKKGKPIEDRHLHIPMTEAVKFPEKNLPVEPYALGALLGDGGFSGKSRVAFTSMDEELVEGVRRGLPPGVHLVEKVSPASPPSRATTYHITGLNNKPRLGSQKNVVLDLMRGLNLMGTKSRTKFIPKEYLTASKEQRLALLRGLMDTDGTLDQKGVNVSFTTASDQLAADVVYLVQSLGGVARRKIVYKWYNRTGEKRPYNSISIKMNVCPFQISRKVNLWKKPTKYKPSRRITGIDYVGKKRCMCISVSSRHRTYLTSDFIVTHNTLLTESCIAGLYGSYVQRGAIKNFLEAPGAQMSLSLSAPGNDCHISHRKAPKGLLSTFNDVECTLRGEVSSQVSPIFGEASVFQAVVFMDQGSKKDLVEAEEAKRIEIFRSLLNLDFLSTFKDTYSKELKTLKDEQKNHAALTEQLESIKARVLRLKESLDETPVVDVDEIKNLREVYARLTRLSEARVKLQDYRNQENLLQKTVSEYEGYDVNALLQRRQSYYSKKSELEQIQQQVKNKEVGCAPNYLPCSFLKNFNVGRMERLEVEVGDLVLNAAETAAINAYSMASRIQNTMKSLWRDEFNDLLDVENKDLEGIQSRLMLLTQQQKHRATVDRELSEAKAEYSRVKAKLDALDAKQDRIKELSFLTGLCDKKGLPLYIISSITKELQKILDSLCETCDNGLRLRISMSKDEQLDCFQILFSYKGSPWAKVVPCASGGQLTILKIVFKLGLMLYLNKFFGNYQVLIMDEPESGLDVENVAVLLRLLDSLRGQFTQIIIVTHNDYITQIADQIVRVG